MTVGEQTLVYFFNLDKTNPNDRSASILQNAKGKARPSMYRLFSIRLPFV